MHFLINRHTKLNLVKYKIDEYLEYLHSNRFKENSVFMLIPYIKNNVLYTVGLNLADEKFCIQKIKEIVDKDFQIGLDFKNL